jgi:hypothetical protein
LILKQVLEWTPYLVLFRPLLAFCSNVVIAIIPPVYAEFAGRFAGKSNMM